MGISRHRRIDAVALAGAVVLAGVVALVGAVAASSERVTRRWPGPWSAPTGRPGSPR